MINLTESQKDILMALQEQGNQFLEPDIPALAKAVKCDEDCVEADLERLKEAGIMTYTATIDAERLGFFTLFVDFTCEYDMNDKIEKLKTFSNTADFSIAAAYVITGDKDIRLEVRVRGFDGYKEFVREFASHISKVATACGTLGYDKIRNNSILELKTPKESEH